MKRLFEKYSGDLKGLFWLALGLFIGASLWSYRPTDPSLNAIVQGLDAASNTKATTQIAKAVAESLLISPPFDQAILTDPGSHIANTIAGWSGYSDAIQVAAGKLDSTK